MPKKVPKWLPQYRQFTQEQKQNPATTHEEEPDKEWDHFVLWCETKAQEAAENQNDEEADASSNNRKKPELAPEESVRRSIKRHMNKIEKLSKPVKKAVKKHCYRELEDFVEVLQDL